MEFLWAGNCPSSSQVTGYTLLEQFLSINRFVLAAATASTIHQRSQHGLCCYNYCNIQNSTSDSINFFSIQFSIFSSNFPSTVYSCIVVAIVIEMSTLGLADDLIAGDDSGQAEINKMVLALLMLLLLLDFGR